MPEIDNKFNEVTDLLKVETYSQTYPDKKITVIDYTYASTFKEYPSPKYGVRTIIKKFITEDFVSGKTYLIPQAYVFIFEGYTIQKKLKSN